MSFSVRKRIGHGLWRWLHRSCFVSFSLALIHGIESGTDSGMSLGASIYLASGVSLLILVVYRLMTKGVTVQA